MEYSSKSNYQRFVCSVPLFVRHMLCSVALSFSIMFVHRSVHRSSVRSFVPPFVELSLSLSSFALRAPLHSGDFTGKERERSDISWMRNVFFFSLSMS